LPTKGKKYGMKIVIFKTAWQNCNCNGNIDFNQAFKFIKVYPLDIIHKEKHSILNPSFLHYGWLVLILIRLKIFSQTIRIS
jgi:hypothetical protein